MPGAAWLDRVPQVLRVQHDAMAMLRLHSPSLCSEATRILREEVEDAQEDERVHSMAIRPSVPCLAGSDVAALQADIAESRSDHFDSIAHLCRALAESAVRTHTRTQPPRQHTHRTHRAHRAHRAHRTPTHDYT